MTKYSSVMWAGLMILSGLPLQANAESSWWDKGISVLNDLNGRTSQGQNVTLSNKYPDAEAAFKQALSIGTENVVDQLGRVNGFNNDPFIHIPLPDELNTIKAVLSKVGMSQLVDDLELKLNRAAESATPKAKRLLLQSINEMTFSDIKTIYEGPENSATLYFQGKMSPSLKKEMQPIVANSLAQVGAIQAYEKLIGQYKALPFVPDVRANLNAHVVQKGMDGIFFYMAKEEASIRKDPTKHTTRLLKRVFGQKN